MEKELISFYRRENLAGSFITGMNNEEDVLTRVAQLSKNGYKLNPFITLIIQFVLHVKEHDTRNLM